MRISFTDIQGVPFRPSVYCDQLYTGLRASLVKCQHYSPLQCLQEVTDCKNLWFSIQ